MCDRTEADQPLKELRREQANPRGRLYPAFGDAPAIVEGVGYPLRMVTPEDLEVLRRHGVPVGLAAQCCNHSASWTIVCSGATDVLAGRLRRPVIPLSDPVRRSC